jgi:iron complex transport system permease protein
MVPVFVVLTGAVLASMTLAVSVGTLPIAPDTVWRIILHRLTGLGDASAWTPIQDNIVWDLRLPRVLLGAVVGAGLSVVGVTVQALVRNPLADPFLLGISSGASVGAVLFIIAGVSILGVASTMPAAFAGALGSFMLVYAFARRGGSLAPMRLILAGVVIAYALTAVTSFLVLQAANPAETRSVLFWLLGSLDRASWSYLGAPVAVLAVGLTALLARARALNAQLVGDETAASLGIDVERLRRELFVLTSLLTGVMVSLSGGIGFVGLVVPHAVRLVVGTDHRRVLPAAALAGGAFLVLVDVVARVALRPQELPVGIVTALVGAPVFLFLMERRQRSGVLS